MGSIHHLKMYLLFKKMAVSHCYVSLPDNKSKCCIFIKAPSNAAVEQTNISPLKIPIFPILNTIKISWIFQPATLVDRSVINKIDIIYAIFSPNKKKHEMTTSPKMTNIAPTQWVKPLRYHQSSPKNHSQKKKSGLPSIYQLHIPRPRSLDTSRTL